MKRLSFLIFIASLFLFSCGLEESYYLPQVPQNYITRTFNTGARINLPSLDSYYYANNGYYTILYKIYISDEDTSSDIQTSSQRSAISADLSRDFELIYSSTDPVSTTSSNGYNILRNRSYYELELAGTNVKNVLTKSGGIINILFPTGNGNPTISLNSGSEINLRRSSELISPEPKHLYFQYSAELSDPDNANSNKNADVSSSGGSYAYVSMYIIAVGLHPSGFTPIYSKPTFISIFRLPNE